MDPWIRMKDDLRLVMADKPEELIPDFIAGNLAQLAALVIQEKDLFDSKHPRGLLCLAVVCQPGFGRTQSDGVLLIVSDLDDIDRIALRQSSAPTSLPPPSDNRRRSR